jgi:hypothetical protein
VSAVPHQQNVPLGSDTSAQTLPSAEVRTLLPLSEPSTTTTLCSLPAIARTIVESNESGVGSFVQARPSELDHSSCADCGSEACETASNPVGDSAIKASAKVSDAGCHAFPSADCHIPVSYATYPCRQVTMWEMEASGVS